MTDLKLCEPAIYWMLKELADGRVYDRRAPQDSPTPFIVYQRSDSLRWRHINGPSGTAQAFIRIDCYDTNSLNAKKLGAKVEQILDGFAGDVEFGTDSPPEFVKIIGISTQNDVDLADQTDEPFLYRNWASYLVTYKQ